MLYLETYASRIGDVYKTLRHKAGPMAHFWRFIESTTLASSRVPSSPRPRSEDSSRTPLNGPGSSAANRSMTVVTA